MPSLAKLRSAPVRSASYKSALTKLAPRRSSRTSGLFSRQAWIASLPCFTTSTCSAFAITVLPHLVGNQVASLLPGPWPQLQPQVGRQPVEHVQGDGPLTAHEAVHG